VSERLANRRVRLLVALFGLVFAAVLARTVWLQGVRATDLGQLAASQQRETIALPARRGTIYDRDGVELALGEEATTVYANPREIRDPQAVAAAVAAKLGIDVEGLAERLADRSRGFVYVARQADPEAARRLEGLDIAGLGFYAEERRTYPQTRVASALIGFAGTDNEGLAGLELRYDRVLSGRDGEETIVRDPFGRLLDVTDTQPVRDGRDITLTIDHRLQARVEQVLRETRIAWRARGATAIVIDPRTGAILAMAVEPGFDANRYGDFASERVRNGAVTDTYEPGSTFKVVTVAGALEDRLVNPGTTFVLPDSIQVSDRVIHEAEERDTEVLTVAEILSRSSNVGAITLALELGKERLAFWIDRFGFGRKTGIDFPGESAGIVLPPGKWTGSTIGNVPIGQGIAVTPLQMAAAYAAIANGGVWRRPHLVERIGTQALPPVERERLFSRRTARALARMMADVVLEGTGTEARVPGYTVAGKTGTAAKPDERGGYSERKYVASFVGFAPARSPRVVILVAVDEPKGNIYGGTVAAPAFAKIAEFALPYLEVPPDAPAAAAAPSPGGAGVG
jgi:cell division protein FtsI/penicillin-binding protein 2